jgi:hypothetical protein
VRADEGMPDFLCRLVTEGLSTLGAPVEVNDG